MLRQLPFELDDQAIRAELTNRHGVQFKDLRLVRNRESGQSRGFAFLEFNTAEEASRWMNATQVSQITFEFSFFILINCNCSNQGISDILKL